MRNTVESILIFVQHGLQWLGAIAALGTLAYSITNMLIAQRRPSGQQTGVAKQVLRTPYLVVATIVFMTLVYIFWIPLPLHLSEGASLAIAIAGNLILIPSLAVYIWGVRTLGFNFNASSGFGVRLQQGHMLVMNGPFAYMRHPMYLGVILACWGSFLLFRTWSMLVWAVIMFGLVYRGHTEEQALSQAFGSQWETYRKAVPGWLPRLKPWDGKENG